MSVARNYNFRDLSIKKQTMDKINEISYKVDQKSSYIQKNLSIIDEKEDYMMGIREPR